MNKFDVRMKIWKDPASFESNMTLYTKSGENLYVLSKVEFSSIAPGEAVPSGGVFLMDEELMEAMYAELGKALGKTEAAAQAAPAESNIKMEVEEISKITVLENEVSDLKKEMSDLQEGVAALKGVVGGIQVRLDSAAPAPKRRSSPKKKTEPEPTPAPSESTSAMDAALHHALSGKFPEDAPGPNPTPAPPLQPNPAFTPAPPPGFGFLPEDVGKVPGAAEVLGQTAEGRSVTSVIPEPWRR